MNAQKPPPDELEDAVVRGAERLLDDSDRMRPYWDRVHDHFWDRTWARITSTAGKWLIGAVLFGFAGWVVTYAVKAGWIK